mmetsp:Transcript_12390/g.16375  ORF Transcript_12390/g.16375 Transcript_12390/m.16375 type:complete len:99 (+) Transcript_12390:17-313(+)
MFPNATSPWMRFANALGRMRSHVCIRSDPSTVTWGAGDDAASDSSSSDEDTWSDLMYSPSDEENSSSDSMWNIGFIPNTCDFILRHVAIGTVKIDTLP